MTFSRALCVLILSAVLISCEAPESHKQREAQQKNTPIYNESRTPTLIVRGMYSVSGDRIIQDCSSGKKYFVSDKSQLEMINEAASRFSSEDNRKKFYVEAEGFISAEQNRETKKMDTVFVIGAVTRIDLQFDCGIK